LETFSAPETGTAASEIRLRAKQLSKQQNELFSRLASKPVSKSDTAVNELHSSHVRGRSFQSNELLSSRKVSAPSSVRVGGEETDSSIRRVSQDSHGRHSLSFETPERVRRSVDRVRSLGGRPSSQNRLKLPRRQTSSPEKKGSSGSRRSSSSIEAIITPEVRSSTAKKMPLANLGEIKAAYLLVSPLQGLVTNLATMWTFNNQKKTKRKDSKAGDLCEEERKMIANDTLAVFGDRDVFTTSKALRSWGCRLGGAESSKFMFVEISGAGHFWHEDGVVGKMRGALKEFVKDL
jgi:hypothetical protein